MSSRELTKRILGNTSLCLLVLAALTVPMIVRAQTDENKSKPAQKAPSKANRENAPARSETKSSRTVQQTPAAQPPRRSAQQAPAEQPSRRSAQQAPAEQPSRRSTREYPAQQPPSGTGRSTTGRNAQAATMGGPERRGSVAGARGGGPMYRPPSGVQTTRRPDGTQIHVDPRTRTTVQTDRGGRIATFERPGLRATGFRPDGRAAHIESTRPDGSTLVVNRGLRGDRRVEVMRPGGVRVVAAGRQAFVERPLRTGYVSRTYIVGGRADVRVYRTHTYRSFSYVTYVPPIYYQPGFYGWAERPWGPRVAYSWGWGSSSPWFYGGYFEPAPFYPTPALWLTDFLLAANLRLAYENQQQSYQDQQQGPPPEMAQGPGDTLSPEIKQQIAEEVRRQLEAEQAAATQPTAAFSPQAAEADALPPALTQRVFVVSTSLDLTGMDGAQTCALTAGDIIERTPGQPVTSDGRVSVNVMSSKAGDCPADFATQIDIATLQDMQNQFRAQIDSGMQNLSDNQGRGGLPPAPAANPRPSADGQAPPNAANDAQARDLVNNLNKEADQTEQNIQQATNDTQ